MNVTIVILQKNSLNTHKTRIHGPKRFTCIDCSSTFAFKGDLNQHRRRKHDTNDTSITNSNIDNNSSLYDINTTTQNPVASTTTNTSIVIPSSLIGTVPMLIDSKHSTKI